MSVKTAITPTRAENYPEWYQQVVRKSDMAEMSTVRGCMVIKPWGYALWENIQKTLDHAIKATGHKNIYCPLLIPVSYFEREAQHIKGFAEECAVVTHTRLIANDEGKLVPSSPLEEPLVIRPTSETIIGEMFSRWVQSYRDLPLLINQWANIVRWEMRPRMFLRTSEFLWQEGHTAHSSAEEARVETMKMLNVYADFVENYLAMPVIKGEKTASERFPGAISTYTIEAMMQDGKALQAGTSHFLGQNFARAFDIKYQSMEGQMEHAWTTSWGSSTRMIGGLIMTHSDDDGLVLPPRIAPVHVVIIPAHHKSDKAKLMAYCQELAAALQSKSFNGAPVLVEIDMSEGTSGEMGWNWVKKGVPVRLEIGPREYEGRTVFMGRRDRTYKERQTISFDQCVDGVSALLEEIQTGLFKRAQDFAKSKSVTVTSKAEFEKIFKGEDSIFVYAFYHDDPAVEAKVKAEFGVTARCLPLANEKETGTCIFSGKSGGRLAVFAKSY